VALDRLIIFLRAPRTGTVKTRLAATIGASAALEAYKMMVEALLRRIESCPGVELRYTPDAAADEIRLWLQLTWQSRPQGSGDLGARMDRAFVETFAAGAQRVAIIGSDCPSVDLQDIDAAWAGLSQNDLVLGPAGDGGYWLIALRQPQPSLFQNMEWSTSSVLAETLVRAQKAGLRYSLLRQLADVDTESDWLEFREQFSSEPPA
jgi:uncharacterized protein